MAGKYARGQNIKKITDDVPIFVKFSSEAEIDDIKIYEKKP